MVCPYSGVLWALIHVAILPQFLPLRQMYARVIVGLVFEQCYHHQPLYASCPHWVRVVLSCRLGVQLLECLAWWDDAKLFLLSKMGERVHVSLPSPTHDRDIFIFTSPFIIYSGALHRYLFILNLSLVDEFPKLSSFLLLLTASQGKKRHKIWNQLSDGKRRSDWRTTKRVDPQAGFCQFVDGQPLPLWHFNSCVFPSWPLQTLLHGLYNSADFRKSSTEIKTKEQSPEKPTQVKQAGGAGKQGGDCLLAGHAALSEHRLG